MRPPSELECFVLGLVWRSGPCSPYTIRRQLQASPSTQWSGSAGAIYPLMQRLERRGLLRSKAVRTGDRPSREYAITPKGTQALRNWIGPPIPADAITVAHDPLRSRLRFLDILTPEQRREWIAAAVQSLEDVLERVRTWEAENQQAEPFGPLVTLSGELDVQGRMKWLKKAAQSL